MNICFMNELLLILLFILLLPSCLIRALHDHDEDSLPSNNIILDAESDIIYQAFVQTGSELHYFKDISYSDSLNLPTSKNHVSDIRVKKHNTEQRNARLFNEDVTNFGKTILGVPVKQEIQIENLGDSSIFFAAVISLGQNFHCSFVEKQYLPPNNRTSFYVYFMPMTEIPSLKEDIIILHTSVGQFMHKVRGEVTGNPYRIKPILNVRVPINGTFSAPIQLHNPHFTQIMLREILASDCNIHLEEMKDTHGKSIALKNSTNMIFQPFQTREIGFVKITGNIERNTTAFLLFKFFKKNGKLLLTRSNKDTSSEIATLILPLQIEITRRRGIFFTVNELDFGFVRTGEKLTPLKLNLFSTLERGIEIETIYTDKSHGVYLQFESRPPISIKSGVKGRLGAAVSIANINIDTNLNENEKYDIAAKNSVILRSGSIITESRGGNYNITVPFKATLYKGFVIHNPEDVSFHNNITSIKRDIMLTNTFPFGLAIYSVDVAENAKDIIQAYLITSPFILLAGQSLLALTLNYTRPKANNFSSYMSLYTNISVFQIPIFVFDGHLEINLHSLEQNYFEFGAMKIGEYRSIVFTLSNPNPVPLLIKKFQLPFSGLLTLNFMGIQKRNTKNRLIPLIDSGGNGMENRMHNVILPTDSIAYFKLTLFIDSSITNYSKDIFSIKTEFSTYKFPVKFYLTNSTLITSIPKKIVYKNAFPGVIEIRPLMLLNFFSETLRVLQIAVSNVDTRFQLSIQKIITAQEILIRPGVLSNIANLSFIPHAICPQNCYLGMELNSSDGQWFAYAMKWPENLAAIDHYLYTRMKQRWINLKEKIVKSSVNIFIDKIGTLEIPVEGNLIWPRLSANATVHFPLTAVGNFSIVNLTLTNPTMYPVIVQIFPFVIYHDPDALLELLNGDLPGKLINPIKKNETLMFTPLDTEFFPLKHGSLIPSLREEVENILEGPVPRFTLSMLIRPGMSTQIRVGFLPSDYTLRSSMLIVRNNLTALESIILYGRGAKMNMEINNKTARTHPLLFELEEQHLSECANPRRQLQKMPTNLTVKRSFTVRNNGEVGFNVVNISINGIPCENRGYRVLNCDRFRLEPNETTFLDIAFTPDFLFYVNEATLQIYIHMNSTPWSFDLSTTIPRHLLSICHSALPRPPFEALMYQTCVLALIFCLICIISCAYLEGDRIVQFAYKQQFLHEQKIIGAGILECIISSEINDIIQNSMILQKRKFLQVSSDARTLNRWFWQTLDFILLIFSYIWPLMRSDQFNFSSRKDTKKQQIINFNSLNKNHGREIQQTQDEIAHTENSRQNGIFIKIKDDKTRLISAYNNDTNRMDIDIESSNSSIISSGIQDYNSESYMEPEVKKSGLQKMNGYKRQNNVEFCESNFPDKSAPESIEKTNVLAFVENCEASTSLQNNGLFSQKKKKGVTCDVTKNTIMKSEKNINKRTNRSPGPIQPPFRNGYNAAEKITSKKLQFNYTFGLQNNLSKNIFNENNKKEGKISEDNNEKSSEISEINSKNTHSTSSMDFDDSGNFGKSLSNDFLPLDMDRTSEESDIPEWLDQNVIYSNVDDELNAISFQSAALFSKVSEENLMIEQSSSQKDRLQDEDDEYFKHYSGAMKDQDSSIGLIIEQITREYHDKLTSILKGRKLTCKIPMPSDLSSNYEENNIVDNTSNSIVAKEFCVLPKSSDNFQQSKGDIHFGRPGFLFNIGDPIWKPICEFDEISIDWPQNYEKQK